MYNKQSVITLFVAALMLMLLPLEWIISSLIAALIHELGHYCAVLIMGGSVHRLKLGPTGAIMEASGLSQRGEVISILAGPLAGLLTLLVIHVYPVVALCGLFQTAYNLLPIYPLDGGRLLWQFILTHGGTYQYFRNIELVIIALLLLLCIYIRFQFGISLFLFLGVILFRNTPCKPYGDWI